LNPLGQVLEAIFFIVLPLTQVIVFFADELEAGFVAVVD
jgi:hypothetical protein